MYIGSSNSLDRFGPVSNMHCVKEKIWFHEIRYTWLNSMNHSVVSTVKVSRLYRWPASIDRPIRLGPVWTGLNPPIVIAGETLKQLGFELCSLYRTQLKLYRYHCWSFVEIIAAWTGLDRFGPVATIRNQTSHWTVIGHINRWFSERYWR